MSKQKLLRREYNIPLKLDSGAELNILLFSQTEHRWLFNNRYIRKENDNRGKVILTNETILTVDYYSGVAKDLELRMNIYRPDKRGKEFFLGVDISEGSHLYAQFFYEKKDNYYRMKKADFGRHGSLNIEELVQSKNDQLIKQIEFPFPFPLKDRIDNEYGSYKVPFLKNNGEIAFFEFPESY